MWGFGVCEVWSVISLSLQLSTKQVNLSVYNLCCAVLKKVSNASILKICNQANENTLKTISQV